MKIGWAAIVYNVHDALTFCTVLLLILGECTTTWLNRGVLLEENLEQAKRKYDEAIERTRAADQAAEESRFIVPAPAVDDTDEIDRINAAVDALEVRLTKLKQAHAREESA